MAAATNGRTNEMIALMNTGADKDFKEKVWKTDYFSCFAVFLFFCNPVGSQITFMIFREMQSILPTIMSFSSLLTILSILQH
jgi:hypothetical protein